MAVPGLGRRGIRGGDVQSRKDQLQAYRFVTTRVQAALLQGEPDAPEPPMRRIGVAAFAGVMIAVLTVAGFGIFGLIRPGDKGGWQAGGTVIVEKETGSRFVYDKRDGLLHPVLNYASARLFLNSGTVQVKYFSRNSLAKAGRGAPIGLAGLPDSLPEPGGMVTGPWAVCTALADQAPSASATGGAATGAGATLSIGFPVPGSRVDPARAVLAVFTDDQGAAHYYLIWNDHALKIPDIRIATSGLSSLLVSKAVPVTGDWINSIPPGPDLKPIDVPGRGRSGATVTVGGVSMDVGQVLLVHGEAGQPDQYYVVMMSGVAPTTATDAQLLLGDPRERLAYPGRTPEPIQVVASDVAPVVIGAVSTPGFPPGAQVPTIIDPAQYQDSQLCSTYDPGSGNSTVSLAPQAPGSGPSEAATAQTTRLQPGHAALVREVPYVGGQPTDAVYLVTDAGVRYPVPSAEALTALGYGGMAATPVLKGILSMIPTGPALDPVAASQPQAVSIGSTTGPAPSQPPPAPGAGGG